MLLFTNEFNTETTKLPTSGWMSGFPLDYGTVLPAEIPDTKLFVLIPPGNPVSLNFDYATLHVYSEPSGWNEVGDCTFIQVRNSPLSVPEGDSKAEMSELLGENQRVRGVIDRASESISQLFAEFFPGVPHSNLAQAIGYVHAHLSHIECCKVE